MFTWLRTLIAALQGHARACDLRTGSPYCTYSMRWRKERTRKTQFERSL